MSDRKEVGPGVNMRRSDIVLDDSRISMAAKGVFATLNLLGNEARVEELGERCNDSPAAVAQALEELRAHGYIEISGSELVTLPEGGRFGLSV